MSYSSSYCKQQYEKYSKLVENLNETLSELNTQADDLAASYTRIFNTYMNQDGSRGRIIDTFQTKVSITQERYQKISKQLDDLIVNIEQKIRDMEQKYDYWVDEYEAALKREAEEERRRSSSSGSHGGGGSSSKVDTSPW